MQDVFALNQNNLFEGGIELSTLRVVIGRCRGGE